MLEIFSKRKKERKREKEEKERESEGELNRLAGGKLNSLAEN